MDNFIKKSVLIGVGVYSKAHKELDKSIKSLIKKNKITKKEGEEMLSDFIKKSKEAELKIEGQIKRNTNSFIKRVSLAKKKDLLVLERRIKSLEAKLNKLSKDKKTTKKTTKRKKK